MKNYPHDAMHVYAQNFPLWWMQWIQTQIAAWKRIQNIARDSK